jgi:two-component system, chemotaxis family, sensor kinase CheA
MDDFEKELKAGFLDEAAQLLADTEQCFLDLENSSEDPSILEKIFRLAHNLKGSARGVGFIQMGEFTHELESLLLKLKNKELQIHTETVTLLLQCNDHLRLWVDTLKADFDAVMDSEALLAEIRAQLSGQGAASEIAPEEVAEPAEPLSLAGYPSADSFADSAPTPEPESTESSEVDTPTEEFAELDSIVSASVVVPVATEPTAVVLELQKKSPPPSSGQAQAPDENIRVSLKRLETLLNNVGELVIMQTVLDQQRVHIASPLVQKTIGQLAKITKDIQDISMSLRMVPLKQTFQKMQRIVRDTSKTLGKEIHLELMGDETELDKTVVEHLGDPLVHLIRNAVDHGIESAEDRVSAGKPAAGRITLNAYHQGNQIVLEIRDDGKGLSAEKLRQKAIEKGIIRADQKLSESECHHLVFAPGFSTHSQVTEISGRGVGMDVVKTNVEKILHGEVQLVTELGKGTCFKILLPLTLAIIDGMVVQAGSEKYIIPITQVHESLQPAKEDVHYVTGMGEVLGLRGETLPLYRLGSVLGQKPQQTDPSTGIAIVVRTAEGAFSILVDDIIGQQQVVIKQLGGEIRGLKGITGGAILGDGKAALILDVEELVARTRGRDRSTQVIRGVA